MHVELEDGSVFDTQTRTVDYLAYEAEAKKRGWGALSDNPSSWEAFIAYRALLRGRFISMPFGNPELPQPHTFVGEAAVVECSAIEAAAESNGEAVTLAYPPEVPADSSSS